jgi:hypothetical protein
MLRVLFAVSVLFILQGCKKEPEKQLCRYPASISAYQVFFWGYEPADVDTIVVRRYTHDGSFSTLIGMDSIVSPAARKSGDTVFQNSGRGRFLTCGNKADYEVVLPALSRTYRIWDISYGPDTADVIIEATDCKNGRTFGPARPHGALIDGPHTIEHWQYGPDIYLKQ